MDVDGALVGDPSSGVFPLAFLGDFGTSGHVAVSCRPVLSETAPKAGSAPNGCRSESVRTAATQ
jgi:hypothetical protein